MKYYGASGQASGPGAGANAWPVAASHLAPAGYAARARRALTAFHACHAKRHPSPVGDWRAAPAPARLAGPYSLIQGINWRKPTPARPAARFGHQKGGADGSTRNQP
jgi:hypothetical protein